MRNKIIIGNWKMNMNTQQLKEFIETVHKHKDEISSSNVIYGIAPVYLHLQMAQSISCEELNIVAQNCYFEEKGAFTGEISISQIKDINLKHVIVGHSERRTLFHESDEIINKKVISLTNNGLTAILCVGESLHEYETGITKDVVKTQVTEALKSISSESMQNVVIAYEPVWAIGTGKTATSAQAQETIKYIREVVTSLYNDEVAENVLIQYGGSVKPNNIKELLEQPDIDGALVGGASLEAASFVELIKNSL